jgi:trehalose synthase
MRLQEVEVQALAPARLEALIGEERSERFRALAASARALLDGRTVLNVNSTAAGGGVAELLQTLLAYARGVGVDARWVVIAGDPAFFAITKRIHNRLYGTPGDGEPLGDEERRCYEATLAANADGLRALLRPGDIVLAHDPQVAGLVSVAKEAGAFVVWRCHVGIDEPNEWSDDAWAFVRPYVETADAFVFSRESFAPPWVPRDRLAVIAPSIDPFSAKNEAIDPADVRQILRYVGLLHADGEPPVKTFTRRDGSLGQITRRVDLVGTGPAPPPEVPVVLQASRWDSLKDMPGVMRAFADHLVHVADAHLVLAGPEARGVADDPEAGAVLEECLALWASLPARVRRRVHLACVPMDDPDEASVIVNALQRHAAAVTQKSLAEGFGLTVVEAMWKSRPVVGSAVGGIVDQIVPGETGMLVDDPHDLASFAHAVGSLLDDVAEADRMGANGHQRASEKFLGDRHLAEWAQLFETFGR